MRATDCPFPPSVCYFIFGLNSFNFSTLAQKEQNRLFEAEAIPLWVYGYRFLLRRKAPGVRPEASLNQRQKKDSLGKCRVSLT